jgi:hypothetical protein
MLYQNLPYTSACCYAADGKLFNEVEKKIKKSDNATPLYPQKLALTSQTSGGRSVGIVRSRNKATELI